MKKREAALLSPGIKWTNGDQNSPSREGVRVNSENTMASSPQPDSCTLDLPPTLQAIPTPTEPGR